MSIMLQKCIILCFIFQLLVEINCQMVPKKRVFHTATFVDDKLYILGGVHNLTTVDFIGKEFFYLDVSAPFNTKKLLWQDLSSTDIVPIHGGAASVKGGANNSTLILYGGYIPDATMAATAALVYTFDPQSKSWSTPTIAGTNIIRKKNVMSVIDDKGKMYIWGGRVITGKQVDTNDMLILDTLNLNWGKGSIVGAPTPRINYGNIFLPDKHIIYIGGGSVEKNIELSLDQVYLYNTISDSWDTRTTSGMVPSAREGFSAVLGLDGQKAIIFGGTADIGVTPLDTTDSLYALNLINFEWYIPKTSGQIPKSRMLHQANVIGKYMVISFGDGYLQSTESDILLLDISNNDEYKWTNTFELPPPSSSSPSEPPISTSVPSSSSNNNSAMIGAVIGSLIGGFLLAIICFLLYKRYKLRQRLGNSVPTPGSERSYHNHENFAIPRNAYNQGRGQEILQIPAEVPIYYNNVYNHGREAFPS